MKALFIAVMLVVCLLFVGWITVGTDGDNPSVSFDTQEAKEDTARAIEVGKDIVAEGQEFLGEAADRITEETDTGTDAEPIDSK